MASFGPGRCGQKPGGIHKADPSCAGLGEVCNRDRVSDNFKLRNTFRSRHLVSAVLITGGLGAGRSAEIYHPARESACVLPDLPDMRWSHTQDRSSLCGGRWTSRSCRKWNSDTGRWDLKTVTLKEVRRGHISWTPADGSVTYLMGGEGSPKTLEAIDKDHNVIASLPLQHRTV